MSIANCTFPVLGEVDHFFAELFPPFIRVCIWGIISGSMSIGVYALLSPQKLIREKKSKIAELQRAFLKADDVEFRMVIALSVRNLKQSFSMLGMVLGPTILSLVPNLIILVWINVFYSYEEPIAGTPVSMAAVPASIVLTVIENGVPVIKSDSGAAWPENGHYVSIIGPDGIELTRLPHHPPVSAVRKWRWWNILLGNDAGYIPQHSAVEEIHFDLKRWHLLNGFPKWLATWEFPFITSVFAWSVALKLGFRIV
jgi:uncharacterized membrane protein (DUF106 family)